MDNRRNNELLEEAVKNHAVIRDISRHRNEDGSLDIKGNLELWNEALKPFHKIKLWENGTPGYDDRDPLQPEPYIVFFPEKDGERNRETILVAHGGGFSWRTGCEGINVAHYFHKLGFNTAVLNYRLIPYSRRDAIADMQRAIRLLRSKKDELGISDKIIAMGFSAGGMLSGNCATHFDCGDPSSEDAVERESCRPDAAVIGYGAMSAVSFPLPFGMTVENGLMGRDKEERLYLAVEKNISAQTPPMFIWQTMSDDGRHGICLAKALQDAEIPYELHIFTDGLHGLAMADGENDLGMNIPHITHWGELCAEWIRDLDRYEGKQ